MAEGTVQANDITLWYETFGDAADPALVLIMGVATQGIFWPTEFCERLAEAGRYVIRFDHRDVGRSTWFGEDATYTHEDMADDVVGLMDALGIVRAHVVGISMGAALAQWTAIRHSGRVMSLTSIMAGPYTPAETAAAGLTPPSLNLAEILAGTPPETREERVAQGVANWRLLWGDVPFDEDDIAAVVGAMHDRAWRPEAYPLHAAGQRTPSRVEALQRLRVPTLVSHGTADALVPPDRGTAVAALIPGAELVLIEVMGHRIPRACWGELADAILRHTAQRSAAP